MVVGTMGLQHVLDSIKVTLLRPHPFALFVAGALTVSVVLGI